VRGFWNGSTLYSRNGNAFHPPAWFKDLLPKDLALDGELWTKRDDFQNAISIIKNGNKLAEWKQITYMVYDAPLLDMPFEKRLEVIKKRLAENPSVNVQYHAHKRCRDKAHLLEETDKILAAGGEGMMVKDPNCKYESRRSALLLKVKKFEDTEATVIGHARGEGRCWNMLGALEMRGDNGVEFKIGSGFDDKQRRKPPKIGSRVTYKFQGLTKDGKPRFPIFMRIYAGM